MDERTKELVCIAASVSAHCQPCLRHHLTAATELGISMDEIERTVQIASIISGKDDENMTKFASELLKKNDPISFSSN